MVVVCGSMVITVFTPCFLKTAWTRRACSATHLVGAQVVGQGARVEVVLVEGAELDAGLAQQVDDVDRHLVVEGALLRRGPRHERRDVDEAVHPAAQAGPLGKPRVAETLVSAFTRPSM